MLDVYFAVRYLQLRDNVPDEGVDRSTLSMLERLHEKGSLSAEAHADLAAAYEFLSILDHSVRLIAGRTTRISRSQARVLDAIAARMEMTSIDDLLGQLTLQRLGIRKWFDDIVR
jgi:glutamine synthetase adenylyltransferase